MMTATQQKRSARRSPRAEAPLVRVAGARIVAPGGRVLFDDLDLTLGRDRVALVGRNGVGKSTLLSVLAGTSDAEIDEAVALRSEPFYVPQLLRGPRSMSHGEARRCALEDARRSGAEILLLDEPTEDLDEAGIAWLRRWLSEWPGCLVVVSHDRRLLQDFEHFLVASESGCRYFGGTLAELDVSLSRAQHDGETRYVSGLAKLVDYEEHVAQVTRRRARKKRSGRARELDRVTAPIRLNRKRGEAQASHGRAAKLREARLDQLRTLSKSARRALSPRLALDLEAPHLSPDDGTPRIILHEVMQRSSGKLLFDGIDLRVARDRVALVGPNGAGKTTLLEIMLGRRRPTAGSASCDLAKVGSIAQGGADWLLDESLLSLLAFAEDAAETIVRHKLPLALAERPLATLSPGERTRAALIALFHRAEADGLDVLVLDEPTFSLDLLAQRALIDALRLWPGGLVVASHDRAFLEAIGITTYLGLGGELRRGRASLR